MYAEAMNEQNKMSEDVWNATIRPIRVRAGFTDAQALNYPSGLSNKEMQKLLRVERRSELAFRRLKMVRYQTMEGWFRIS